MHSTTLPNSAVASKSTFVIAIGVTIALLYFGRQIFIPLALALVLSFLLTPLVAAIQKIHLGRVPAVLIVLLFCFAVTVTVGWGVSSQILEITSHLRDYKTNIEEKIQSLHARKNAPIMQATATVQELNKELAAAPAVTAEAAKNRDQGAHTARPIPD